MVEWVARNTTRGTVLAERVAIAESLLARTRGLLGTRVLPRSEALLLRPCRSVHTFGMRFPIDVAFCRRHGETFVVMSVVEMRPWRLGRPRPRATCVIEAEAGAFGRWRLLPGDELEIKG